jgi:hypothetical protein
MIFIALGSVRAGTQRERITRRMQWSYSPGMKIIAEYHLMTPNPAVISIAEADDIAPMMAATTQWDDVIAWTVVPAVTVEQSLEMAKKMMG